MSYIGYRFVVNRKQDVAAAVARYEKPQLNAQHSSRASSGSIYRPALVATRMQVRFRIKPAHDRVKPLAWSLLVVAGSGG